MRESQYTTGKSKEDNFKKDLILLALVKKNKNQGKGSRERIFLAKYNFVIIFKEIVFKLFVINMVLFPKCSQEFLIHGMYNITFPK